MTKSLTTHISSVWVRAVEFGLSISVPKSIITLFTPQFTQSSTHPHLSPWMTPSCPYWSYFRPPFDLLSLHRFHHHMSPCWHQLQSAKINEYYYLYIPNPILFHLCRSHLVHIINPETSNSPKFCSPRCHRLRWLPLIIHTRNPKSVLSMITFPY